MYDRYQYAFFVLERELMSPCPSPFFALERRKEERRGDDSGPWCLLCPMGVFFVWSHILGGRIGYKVKNSKSKVEVGTRNSELFRPVRPTKFSRQLAHRPFSWIVVHLPLRCQALIGWLIDWLIDWSFNRLVGRVVG